MFTQHFQPPTLSGDELPKKPPVRFVQKILAQIHGKPLEDHTRDRVVEEERQRQAIAAARPKPIKKKKAMKPAIAPTPISQAGKAPEGIQSTTKYNLFSLLPTNRPVDQRHVNKLAAAIRQKNLLHLNPIVVNAAMEVIDGQHRLEAAKKLGVAIFYAQDAEVSQDDIAGMNSNKKNWGLQDYIHFYAAQGREGYVRFTEFCEEHTGLQTSTLLALCSKDGSIKRSYKDGLIDISGMEVASQVISYMLDFKDYTPFYNTAKFLDALSFLVRSGLYDHQHMKAKLEQAGDKLQPEAQVKGWIVSLQRIYNYRMQDASIVMFLKRI